MVIFVCGVSGSGKSFFAKHLAKTLEYKYIPVDEIGHKIYENNDFLQKVYLLFGNEINNENGVFDRKKLGKIIFSEKNTDRVKIFNELSWQIMKKEIENEITNNCIIDWFMLPKIDVNKNLKILVKPISEELCVKKIIERDNLTEEYVKLRNNAGAKYKENDFDFVLINNYTFESLNENIKRVVEYIDNKKHS